MKVRKMFGFSFRICLPLCLLVLIFATSTPAQSRSTISGYVFGPQQSPIEKVTVELRNDVNSVVGRTSTNASGQYRFLGVPNGRVSITVLPLGTNFESQSQEVQIGGIGARGLPIPEHAQVDFYLRLRKEPQGLGENDVVFAQEVPDEAKRTFQSAIADLDSKRPQQGILGLKRAVEIFPTYFAALSRLGAEQLTQEQYEDAVQSFSTALSVNQRSFLCWYGLSYANFALKKWKAVIDSAEKALEIDKNSVRTLILLGIAQRNVQKFEDAERSLVRAKKLDDLKTPDIYWNLALLYAYNLKKYQDAADALELYLKANPSTPETQNIKKLIRQFRDNRPPGK